MVWLKNCIKYFQNKSNMADNLKKTGPQDSSKINVHEKHETDYWTQALGVPKDKLIATVEKVGNSADAVKKALKKDR